MNEINWTTKAIKQLLKIGMKPIEQQIKNAVAQELTDFTHSRHVKKLTNHGYDYRLRVGNYRVMFNHTVGGIVNIVTIEEVKKRDERTY